MLHVFTEEPGLFNLKLICKLFTLKVTAKTLNGESMFFKRFYVYDSLTGSNDLRRHEDHYRKKKLKLY